MRHCAMSKDSRHSSTKTRHLVSVALTTSETQLKCSSVKCGHSTKRWWLSSGMSRQPKWQCVKYVTGRYDVETGSPMQRFRLQGGRTWLQLLRSCDFPRQGVLFQAEAKSSCGDPKRRSDKSENRNSGEFTQEMRVKFVVRLGWY